MSNDTPVPPARRRPPFLLGSPTRVRSRGSLFRGSDGGGSVGSDASVAMRGGSPLEGKC